jgi:hypothetical protein
VHTPLLLTTWLALAGAQPAAPAQLDPVISAAVGRVEPRRMEATVAKLVSFGTRHTLSDAASKTRGIGAAREWLKGAFAEAGRQPGSRLVPFEDRFVAEPTARIPKATELVNVGAVLPGTDASRKQEAVVVVGHYDSRATDVLDGRSDAPGAVDNGSGTAMVLELARVFADQKPAIDLYLVAVAGEEQGLIGAAHLAERLQKEGRVVRAVVSVDIAGNSEGQDGVRDSATARLFSEGVPTQETPEQKKLREALGAENEGASREWARYLERVGEAYVENLDLLVMLRRDRIGRGSDHTAFTRLGVAGVRLSETHEHYDRQHQDVRKEGARAFGDDLAHFDAAYSAKMGRALGAGLLSLALAPAPVSAVTLGGAVSPDTRLRWTLPADPRVAGVVLYRRRADQLHWERAQRLTGAGGGKPGAPASVVLEGVVPDNSFFAVATVDAQGHESLPQPPSALEP